MPVPRRRQSRGVGMIPFIGSLVTPSSIIKLFDIDFLFQNLKPILLWGFTPFVIYQGLLTEPKPSFIDIFNIWE